MKLFRCDYCGLDERGGLWFVGPDGTARFACASCQEAPDKKDVIKADREAKRLADIRRLETENRCRFYEAWAGYCGDSRHYGVVNSFPFCSKHSQVRCGNPGCQNQAVAECTMAGSLVCGMPYCQECGRHRRH